jgi:hypothetical protein
MVMAPGRQGDSPGDAANNADGEDGQFGRGERRPVLLTQS